MTLKDSDRLKKIDAEVYNAKSSEHAVIVRLLKNFQALSESEINTDNNSVILKNS